MYYTFVDSSLCSRHENILTRDCVHGSRSISVTRVFSVVSFLKGLPQVSCSNDHEAKLQTIPRDHRYVRTKRSFFPIPPCAKRMHDALVHQQHKSRYGCTGNIYLYKQ